MLRLCTLLMLLCYVRAAEICCANVGCFNNNAPYNGQPLPKCPDTMNPLKYTMYTRANRNTGQTFTHTTVPSIYSGTKRTVFIAHGWQSNGNSAWLTSMKNAFLDREDINAVIVDWGGGADILDYPQAAANTRSVGAYTALVFANLVRNGGSNTRMWCVGHSLGAHMCGHAGMKTTLQRVTGMDPAGPWFEGSLDRTVGLNPTSARLVDVIHTDTTYGTLRDIGHIDFYPSGGKNQPGCSNIKSELSADELEAGLKGDLGCSHGRAHEFMLQSVKTDCFLSRSKCTNYNTLPGSCSTCTCGTGACAIMGYGADKGCQQSGWFYLTVTSALPFCTN